MAENANAAEALAPVRIDLAASRYRGLIRFWAVVLCVLTAGAVTLQILGPVRPRSTGQIAPALAPATAGVATPAVEPKDTQTAVAAPAVAGAKAGAIWPVE